MQGCSAWTTSSLKTLTMRQASHATNLSFPQPVSSMHLHMAYDSCPKHERIRDCIQVMPLGVLSIVCMPNESKASYMGCSCTGLADAIIWLWAVTSSYMCRTMMYSEQLTSTEIT